MLVLNKLGNWLPNPLVPDARLSEFKLCSLKIKMLEIKVQ